MSYKSKKSLYEQVLCAALSDVLMLNVEGPAASVLRGLHRRRNLYLCQILQLVAMLEDHKPALEFS